MNGDQIGNLGVNLWRHAQDTLHFLDGFEIGVGRNVVPACVAVLGRLGAVHTLRVVGIAPVQNGVDKAIRIFHRNSDG